MKPEVRFADYPSQNQQSRTKHTDKAANIKMIPLQGRGGTTGDVKTWLLRSYA